MIAPCAITNSSTNVRPREGFGNSGQHALHIWSMLRSGTWATQLASSASTVPSSSLNVCTLLRKRTVNFGALREVQDMGRRFLGRMSPYDSSPTSTTTSASPRPGEPAHPASLFGIASRGAGTCLPPDALWP